MSAAARAVARLDEGFTKDTIRNWLTTQQGVSLGYVRLDTGDIVRDGGDADDEGDLLPDTFDRNNTAEEGHGSH